MVTAVPILVNPAAGGGRAERAARAAAELLSRRGVLAEVRVAPAPGDIERLARDLAASAVPRILVAGGDGTVHEAVNALAHTDVVLGVVPAGRGNDFAAAIGVRGGPDAAVKVFLEGRTRRVDLGRVNGRRFATVLAAGLDAEVAARTRTGIWRYAGRPGYVLCGVLQLLRYHAPAFRLTGDFGRRDAVCLLSAVSNTGSYGGGVPIAPDASVDDGRFDVCLVREVPLLKALGLIPRILKGRHRGLDPVEFLRTRTLELTSDPAVQLIADGEPVGSTPVRVVIEPAALRVMAPECHP